VTLRPLQVQIAQTVARLPEARGFALAGGGALVVLGVVDRPTQDLDFFATSPEAVDALAPAVEQALVAAGLSVEARRRVPGFTQFVVADSSSSTLVDLSWDARLRPTQATEVGPVLATDELAADKTLALLGRAEARDFVDVYRLRATYSREQLADLARQKDRGFDLEMFASALDGMSRHDRRDLPVDEDTHRAMRQEFGEWRRALTAELGPRLDRGARRLEPPGRDLGLGR
jgi:hypothetical protein